MAKYPNHPQYIPIIKWQSWEQRALQNVEAALLPRLQPCIEVRTSQQHGNLINRLSSVWPHQALVDYANPSGVLTPVRLSEMMAFVQHAVQNHLLASPVLAPEHVVSIGPQFLQLATALPTVAVRLRLSGLSIPQQKMQVTMDAYAALRAAGISPMLIVDLGVSPNKWLPAQVASFCQDLRALYGIGYQTTHISSGAYPASLASVKTGMDAFERNDWKFWRDLTAAAPDLVIGYSDYGTLSPEWTEKVLEMRGTRIAIRYTRADDWLILRADGKTTEDSIAISEILVYTYAQDFKDASYSYGDLLLAERADPAVLPRKKRCGHYHITEAWSHHIAYVLKEQY